jgi:outer membrane protein
VVPGLLSIRRFQSDPRRRGARACAWPLLVLSAAASACSVAEPAHAQDTLRVSLEACVAHALDYGEEIRLAEVDRSVASARYLQARSTALPQISLNATYTRQIESVFGQQDSGGPSFEPDTTTSIEDRVRALEDALPGSGFYALSQLFSQSSFASKNSWVVGLTVKQKLFQGGSIWGSIAAARHALKSADLLREDRAEDVTLVVRQTYLDALLADRRERIVRLGLDQAETHLTRVRLRQEAGDASEYELLQAEVARDNQIPQVKAVHEARQLAYLELRRVCNFGEAPLALTSPLLEDRAVPADPARVDTVGIGEEAMRHAGVVAAEEALQAREHAIPVAAAALYPEFSVFGGVSQQAYPADVFPERRDWIRDKNVGVMVSWNIFDGFLTKGAIREAKANRDRARHDLAGLRELVGEAVLQGRLEMERSAADLRARTRTVELAERTLYLANLRYDEGAASQLEVNDARIAWQIALNNEAEARRDYFLALALLERYTGRPLFTEAAPQETGS